jgi:hypothetical protein
MQRQSLCLLLALVIAATAGTAQAAPEDGTPATGTSGAFALEMPDDLVVPRPLFDLQEPGDPENGIPFCCDEPKFRIAAAEVLALQVIPWFFNRHVADDETAVVGIESWARNIREGFEWDNNDFKTNMFMHPFHGSVYFNAARSNGYDYWESAAFAWAGSFIWEMFGENNRGAINDWVATSAGGMAIGESFHRTAKSIRDNTSTGLERGGREFAAFLLDPVGSFNRVLRGETSRVGPNDPDHRPAYADTNMRIGTRALSDSQGRSDTPAICTSATERECEGSVKGGFFELDYFYGDPFKEHSEPFSNFELRLQINGNDVQTLGRFQIDGSVWTSSVKSDDKSKQLLSANQLYDYVYNAVFETGGQSLALTYLWERNLSDTWRFRARVQPTVALIWAVQSDIAEEAEGRNYDFGSGGGIRTRLQFRRHDRDIVEIMYLLNWSHTLSGADGSHLVQFVTAQAQFPVWRSLGLGVSWGLGARNSYYRDHPNVKQTDHSTRIFLTLF